MGLYHKASSSMTGSQFRNGRSMHNGTILIIRHAQTMSNAEARWHGSKDEKLSAAGRLDATAARGPLRAAMDDSVQLVISSDLRRARETAEILAAAIDVRLLVQDPRLRERDMGEWTGRTPREVDVLWPGLLKAWMAGEIDGPPGGEKDGEVAERVRESLSEHTVTQPGSVLVVTHGGVLRSLRREAGLESRPVPHLGGHWAWIDRSSGQLVLGAEVLLGDPAMQPLT